MSILVTGTEMRRQLADALPWTWWAKNDGQITSYVCPSCFAVIPHQVMSNQKTAVELHIDWHVLMHDAINSGDALAMLS